MNSLSRLLHFHRLPHVVQLDILPSECGVWSSSLSLCCVSWLSVSCRGRCRCDQHLGDGVRSGVAVPGLA